MNFLSKNNLFFLAEFTKELYYWVPEATAGHVANQFNKFLGGKL